MANMEEKNIKVQVQNLTKKFGDLTVLDNISFNINNSPHLKRLIIQHPKFFQL